MVYYFFSRHCRQVFLFLLIFSGWLTSLNEYYFSRHSLILISSFLVVGMLVFKKRPLWKFLLELLSYACFTCVLYMIIYSTHGSAKYYQVKHLRRLLLNPENATYSFQKVRISVSCVLLTNTIPYLKIVTIDNCWNWLIKSFVTNIFVGDWYNGHPINDSSGFLSDKSNRLIGWATMRQLRIKRG